MIIRHHPSPLASLTLAALALTSLPAQEQSRPTVNLRTAERALKAALKECREKVADFNVAATAVLQRETDKSAFKGVKVEWPRINALDAVAPGFFRDSVELKTVQVAPEANRVLLKTEVLELRHDIASVLGPAFLSAVDLAGGQIKIGSVHAPDIGKAVDPTLGTDKSTIRAQLEVELPGGIKWTQPFEAILSRRRDRDVVMVKSEPGLFGTIVERKEEIATAQSKVNSSYIYISKLGEYGIESRLLFGQKAVTDFSWPNELVAPLTARFDASWQTYRKTWPRVLQEEINNPSSNLRRAADALNSTNEFLENVLLSQILSLTQREIFELFQGPEVPWAPTSIIKRYASAHEDLYVQLSVPDIVRWQRALDPFVVNVLIALLEQFDKWESARFDNLSRKEGVVDVSDYSPSLLSQELMTGLLLAWLDYRSTYESSADVVGRYTPAGSTLQRIPQTVDKEMEVVTERLIQILGRRPKRTND